MQKACFHNSDLCFFHQNSRHARPRLREDRLRRASHLFVFSSQPKVFRHSGKFSIRIAKENLSGIRFVLFIQSTQPLVIPQKPTLQKLFPILFDFSLDAIPCVRYISPIVAGLTNHPLADKAERVHKPAATVNQVAISGAVAVRRCW